jgi:Zn-finger nucleic acid-binding protein
MKCPNCGASLKPVSVKSIRLERCPDCHGTWYEKDQLRLLKDRAHHKDYRWIDFDLWRDRDKFRAGEQRNRSCPEDAETLQTVRYGDSDLLVDICTKCEGIFLEEGEYRAILRYLEHKVNSETVGDYLHDVEEEFVDLFTGPEGFFSELADLGKVLSLLQMRFAVQHQKIANTLRDASRGIPGA